MSINYSSFQALAYQLNCNHVKFWLNHNPQAVANETLARIKLGAKILSRTTGVTHSSALESVSRAFDFTSWHDLFSLVAKISSSSGTEEPPSLLERFRLMLILHIEQTPDVAMQPNQLSAFEDFAARLAAKAECSIEQALDSVCAGLCGESTWSAVKRRNPLNTVRPLYQFRLLDLEPSEGRFETTAACSALIEELDEIYQGADTKPKQKRAKKWIEQALSKQPDFLEAGLCLAQIYFDWHEDEKALSTVDLYIAKAESLIPKGFRGRIIWGVIDNRFYHRLLWLRLSLLHFTEQIGGALKDARKQLRLNPNDNLGVRTILPLLLLQNREYEKALKAAKFKGEGGDVQTLVQAFCFYAVGDRHNFVARLVEALFEVPALRVQLFLGEGGDLPEGDEGYRGIRPSLESFSPFAWGAIGALPGLSEAYCSILRNPLVMEAEAELRSYWTGFWGMQGKGQGDPEGWRRLKTKHVNAIAHQVSI